MYSLQNLHHLRLASEWLAQADGLLIAAGAGMGVDSGLPDFRGDQGLWRAYPALERAGLRFVEIANPASFDTDPRLAWGFYGHRLALYRRTRPHAGFGLLQQLAEHRENGLAVITSNVDGQFQAAGFAEDVVHECHGSIHFLQCTRPCKQEVWPASSLTPVVDEAQCQWLGELPRCAQCGALARPNILMFDDAEWIPDRTDAQQARLEAWLGKTQHPVIIELGAGTHVPSVRNFNEQLVRTHGAKLIRINPRDADVPSKSAIGLSLSALDGLQALVVAR